MKSRSWLIALLFVTGASGYLNTKAQEPATPTESAPQQRQGGGRGQGEGGPRPLFGKITSLTNGTLVLSRPDGQVVTVKLTEQTEFRKDGNKTTAADFKVGDMVVVRGEENADKSVTARMIGTRTSGPGGGPGGRPMGTLGKDYVAGEIKGIDAAKLTILRPDNVTQTIELNEETSLRKGRESITMADVHLGDHVMVRGTMQNEAFVPKNVMVINEEQWKHIEEMGAQNGMPKPAGAATEAAPAKP